MRGDGRSGQLLGVPDVIASSVNILNHPVFRFAVPVIETCPMQVRLPLAISSRQFVYSCVIAA